MGFVFIIDNFFICHKCFFKCPFFLLLALSVSYRSRFLLCIYIYMFTEVQLITVRWVYKSVLISCTKYMWNLKEVTSYATCRPQFTLYWKKNWDICFLLLHVCDILFDTCVHVRQCYKMYIRCWRCTVIQRSKHIEMYWRCSHIEHTLMSYWRHWFSWSFNRTEDTSTESMHGILWLLNWKSCFAEKSY